MTTTSEFIEGPELDKIIVHNCDKYRKSFISIVQKSGVGDVDVEQFLKDRRWMPSPPTKKIIGFFLRANSGRRKPCLGLQNGFRKYKEI